MKKKILLVLIASVLLVSACSNDGASNKPEKVTEKVSYVYPELSKEELKENSDLIVEGHFKSYGEPFGVKPSNGGEPRVFKDGEILVDRVIKGDVKKGDSIMVRTLGGDYTSDDKLIYSTVNEDEPNFKKDTSLVLFLYKTKGGLYETDDNYYKLLGGPDHILYYDEEEKSYISDNKDHIFSKEELGDISKVAGEVKDIEKEQMQKNLADKNISQEEYDDWLKARETYGSKMN